MPDGKVIGPVVVAEADCRLILPQEPAMTTELMNESHRAASCGAAFDWCLPGGSAEALDAGPDGCFVRVEEGALWLTRTLGPAALARGEQPDDLWLAAGESLWLPAGSRWVLQAWPVARVRLLQAPPARHGGSDGRARPEGRSARPAALALQRWAPSAWPALWRRFSAALAGASPRPSALG
jgi:hypothetical protein